MAQSMLLDTNIWLDYFLPGRNNHKDAFALVHKAIMSGWKILVSYNSLKDVYYLLQCELKCALRAAGHDITEKEAALAREDAWGCISCIMENATVVNASMNDARMALHLRNVHPDFEDNLILASALQSQADFLVTGDAQLLAHSPIPAYSAQMAASAL